MAEHSNWNRQNFRNNEGGLFLSYVKENGAKCAAGLRRVFPNHGVRYPQSIELVESGPNEGAILCQTPGVFSINCGELPSGATAEQAGVAGVWYAKNGDLILDAPHGTVRIIANNIELTSCGNPDKGKGNISLVASGTFRTSSDKVNINAGDVAVINGENQLGLISSNKLNMVAGTIKENVGSDIASFVTSLGGNKTIEEWTQFFEKLRDFI